MDILGILNLDMDTLKEAFKTENIMSVFKKTEPLSFLMQPLILIVGLVVGGVLTALKMSKALTLIFAGIGIWFAAYYTMPDLNQDIVLGDLGGFIAICTGILAVVCYIFIVKGD